MAHERLATNKRDLHRLVSLDKGDNPLDERITAQIAELAQGDTASQVCIAVCVASWASERALAGDLD